jgi:hypothetical protein
VPFPVLPRLPMSHRVSSPAAYDEMSGTSARSIAGNFLLSFSQHNSAEGHQRWTAHVLGSLRGFQD